jgi:hypothetical protein
LDTSTAYLRAIWPKQTMGNAVSGPAIRVQAGALDSYVSELGPDIYYDKRSAQVCFRHRRTYWFVSSLFIYWTNSRRLDLNAWTGLCLETMGLSIGHSRFLKTVKANHRNGPLLIKVFVKPDPGLTVLRTYHSRLNSQLFLFSHRNMYLCPYSSARTSRRHPKCLHLSSLPRDG